MKRLFLVVALVLAATACGGDNSTAPLSQSEYSAQGNAICDRMNSELDALSIRASSGVSPEEERDLFVEASDVSRQGIDALFELIPPASLVDDREVLLELVEERRQLIGRLNNGEDLFDQVNAVNQQFDDEAKAIWPSCTT